MKLEKILVVDDEPILRSFLKEVLKRKGKTVYIAKDGLEGIEVLKKNDVDLIITDLKMPNKSGIDVLTFAKSKSKELIVILMTAHATIESAVEAMQMGAFHYLIKPFSQEAIEVVLQKAEEHFSLISENQFLKQEALPNIPFIAKSKPMKDLLKTLSKIAKSSASVFISGESGTGKEVIAKCIHLLSKRKEDPFITVNCPAIPDTLIESEFFGHEKGSFTGALQKRIGRFERAHNGTLLLDEVTEIPILMQPKLLRVIQEQEFERVGGSHSIRVDVRFISTTNRAIQKSIDEKIFREDLYYRLNVVPIHIPPLRDRKEDILPLANHFIQKLCKEHHLTQKQLSKTSYEKLLAYSWPGNVRELCNVIERAIVLTDDPEISDTYLFLDEMPKERKNPLPIGKSLKEVEKEFILQTLADQKQNRSQTAKILGITLKTLRNKLNDYNPKNLS